MKEILGIIGAIVLSVGPVFADDDTICLSERNGPTRWEYKALEVDFAVLKTRVERLEKLLEGKRCRPFPSATCVEPGTPVLSIDLGTVIRKWEEPGRDGKVIEERKK